MAGRLQKGSSSMRHAGLFLILGLALAGCPGPGDDPPDVTPDAGSAPDALEPPAGAGLVFLFESEPRLGDDDLGGEYNPVIEEAVLTLAQVRAIGDSAPGDARTSADRLTLSWDEGEAEELEFPQAPPGFYAQLLAELTAFEITGTLQISGDRVPFHIAQAGVGLEIAVGLDGLELEPGMDRTVTITVELGDVIEAVDWDQVPEGDDGVRRVSPESEDMQQVRERLQDGFDDDDDGGDGSGLR
jgi:hypothetical protein